MPADNPREVVAGVDALKAFTHPLRMRMYDYLNEHGSATATQLAREFGESTGQTSYHLRQLERHGFVADDPTRGTGRERWWRAIGFSMGIETLMDPAADLAARTLMQSVLAEQAAVLNGFVARTRPGDDWDESSLIARQTSDLTLVELRELLTALQQTLDEHTAAAKARSEAGADAEDDGVERRRVRVYLDVIPLAPTEG